MADGIALLACGIFTAEFKALDPGLRSRFRPVFFDSMLHMSPALLDGLIAAELPPEGTPAVILYGDCSPHMLDYEQRPGCARTRGINCCEICLGPERFRELRRSGAFMLMPEWSLRWAEVFKQALGFDDRELARSFMRESMNELVYLDTNAQRLREDLLAAASDHLGLPLRIEGVGTGFFETAIRSALEEATGDR